MAVKVLIVDDQAAFRSAAREVVVSTVGFEVVGEASTGEESVAAARRLRPDLVLMDVRLPGVDGLEASYQIRSEHEEITVFLLSTYDEEEFAPQIGRSRATAFIPKFAFSSDSLLSTWGAVIGRRKFGQIGFQEEET
ncbi:MAG TPA: response regulator transcription factor [Candidatus Dormibacteraeota bacterium]|nr:response regulator transcription factor [Candidatus Dormibacteraeota bacterium]